MNTSTSRQFTNASNDVSVAVRRLEDAALELGSTLAAYHKDAYGLSESLWTLAEQARAIESSIAAMHKELRSQTNEQSSRTP